MVLIKLVIKIIQNLSKKSMIKFLKSPKNAKKSQLQYFTEANGIQMIIFKS